MVTMLSTYIRRFQGHGLATHKSRGEASKSRSARRSIHRFNRSAVPSIASHRSLAISKHIRGPVYPQVKTPNQDIGEAMEQSEIPTVPPRLPPINQGNRNMVDINREPSPLIFEERNSPNLREHHQFYTAYEDTDDMPREGLESSWSYNRADLWVYSPDESFEEDDEGCFLRVSQSTQTRFGLPPLNRDKHQQQSRSKSIDKIPYHSIYRSSSGYSTKAHYGSVCQDTEEWDGEFDPEAIRYFRSLTPVEIEWMPPPETGDFSPISDTGSDLASVYLPSLVTGGRRPRPLTPFPDSIREEHTEVTHFRHTKTPQQTWRTEWDSPEVDTTKNMSRSLKKRHRKISDANRDLKSSAEHFQSAQGMHAEDRKELWNTSGSSSTEDSDKELEHSYQKDSDQYFEDYYEEWEDSDQDCDNELRDSGQDLVNSDQNLDSDHDLAMRYLDCGSKVTDQDLGITDRIIDSADLDSKEPNQVTNVDQCRNDTEKNLGSLKDQWEEAEGGMTSGMKSKTKSFFDSKFKAYSTRQAAEDEAQDAKDDPQDEAGASDGNLKRKQKLELELSEAELDIKSELTEAWKNYEHEQNRYFKTMARVREEQEIANHWRLDALQYRLSYVMLKAELDEKKEEARTTGSPP
ncbi:hypothetical protein LOTGIDRAFT_239603 [Lottia gigantea]|uniref:Uncharacterized protein n=1 Tax=Lottia gigantea TaxID=225164 RepID=V4A6V4_LOTGI|nr:hypothetical protein LOTGIDRAFT_239603 [Lottia gigantea]ESO90750.1 hypothetical protein LOTGIDRAFT_239603 [Lottia gigantea]